MKNKLVEYIELTEKEKSELWDRATFVFDTNVLLNLYRYSSKTSTQMLKYLKILQDRTWIPYQVAEEYMKRRYDAIYDRDNKYTLFNNEKEKFLNSVISNFRIKKDDEEYKILEKNIDSWLSNYKKNYQKIETNNSNDKVLDQILIIYDNKIGDPYSKEELEKIETEGKERFEKEIPPGFKDSKKEKNQYGDLIVWKQIIDFSKENKKDIIFITDDQKEDWWNISKGKTIGPRIELRKEFIDATGQRFHMYNMDSFIDMFKEKINNTVDISVINEIKRTSRKMIIDEEPLNYELPDFYNQDYIKKKICSYEGRIKLLNQRIRYFMTHFDYKNNEEINEKIMRYEREKEKLNIAIKNYKSIYNNLFLKMEEKEEMFETVIE